MDHVSEIVFFLMVDVFCITMDVSYTIKTKICLDYSVVIEFFFRKTFLFTSLVYLIKEVVANLIRRWTSESSY